jgi:hypothetical protein
MTGPPAYLAFQREEVASRHLSGTGVPPVSEETEKTGGTPVPLLTQLKPAGV